MRKSFLPACSCSGRPSPCDSCLIWMEKAEGVTCISSAARVMFMMARERGEEAQLVKRDLPEQRFMILNSII